LAADVGLDLGGLEEHAAPDSNRSQAPGVNLAAHRAERDPETAGDVSVGEEVGGRGCGWG